MDKLVVNAITGETQIVPLTAEEVAAIQAAAADEPPPPAPPSKAELLARIAALEALVAALPD